MIIFWILFVILSLPLLLVAPTKVIGKKNYNKKDKYIVMCNHQSFFDPMLLDFYLGKRIRFIAKKELWKNKEKSFLFDNVLGCIPVDRAKGLTISATKKIYSIIENGENLGLFPEGKRYSDTNHDIAVKNGACIFSIKTKTPLLPCFFMKHQKPFVKNTLLIGKPFELKEFYDKKLDKETLAAASQIVIEKLTTLKTEYEDYLREKALVKQLKKNKAKNK